jgi:hypothetical protein
MRTMKKLLFLLVITCIFACHKDDPKSPEKAVLTFPAQNALCTSGSVLSATQSSIVFTWNAAANTDSYELDIKNLLTNTTTTQNVTTNQATVTLLRNTPYSWFVISKSNSVAVTVQSDSWKFYNSGLGIVSYSPFPATITSPTFGQSVTATAGTVNLTWTGSDVDNDIATYDVYFGTTTTPAFKSNVTTAFLNSVSVTSGTTYYWKVITKDTQGNTSDSGIYQFTVN